MAVAALWAGRGVARLRPITLALTLHAPLPLTMRCPGLMKESEARQTRDSRLFPPQCIANKTSHELHLGASGENSAALYAGSEYCLARMYCSPGVSPFSAPVCHTLL